MEAYDAAVLSYALATAGKLKPGLLGIAPNIAGPQDVSLTPPHPVEPAGILNSLSNVDQALANKIPIPLPQLIELCSHKQVSWVEDTLNRPTYTDRVFAIL